MKSVCVNASNLHAGGGVQVAVSFVYELSNLARQRNYSLSVIVSTEVHRDLMGLGADTNLFFEYLVVDTYGLGSLSRSFGKLMAKFDLVFTVFGPAYFFGYRGVSLVGFAQPWIIYPDNEIYRSRSLWGRMLLRVKFGFQRIFFGSSAALIVELEHVRHRIVDLGVMSRSRVHVVPNAISALYFKPEQWRSVELVKRRDVLSFGFIGRDYPHKNTDFLLRLKKSLYSKFGVDADFFVTFSESEWLAKSEDFRANIVNVGPLSVSQCPSFYSQMDAIVFPSLLECFSATPLEAMAMKTPLFASDRGFVRDVCGDYVGYFDPSNEMDAAALIAASLTNGWLVDQSRLEAARVHAVQFSSAEGRARKYLDIVESYIL